MSLQQILGQDKAIEVLNKSVRNKSLAHAYLFYGPSGVGKKLVAIELAKSLNCLVKGPAENCGHCISCRKIEGGS